MPADEFDAEPDAVLRFAAQLAASERRVAGWVDRRASAIRIRLASDPERRLVYVVEVPERAGEALRTALRSFEGVEERPAAEVLGEAEPSGERVVLRTELVLARPSVEPLARLSPKPDPLQPFAAAIGRLHSDAEDASVCVDLLPASGFRVARLRRRLRREARRIHGERRDWAALLNGEERRRGRPDPQEQVERRGAVQAVDAKLRDSGELFEAQILLRSAGADPRTGRSRRCRACSPPSGRSPIATIYGPPGCRSPASPSSAPTFHSGARASTAASPPASSGRPARRS